MEKIPTADSVLKVFHRIATIEGGYVPPVAEPEEKDEGKSKDRPGKKKKYESNDGRRSMKVAKKNEQKRAKTQKTEIHAMEPLELPQLEARIGK